MVLYFSDRRYIMKNGVYLGNSKNGEIEIIGTDEVFENEYIEVFNDKVVFPKGNEGTYLRVNSKTSKSVAVLPFVDDGKAVLITNFRHGARGWGLEIPKGAVEPDEDDIPAVQRELAEETGYESDRIVFVGEYNDSPAVCYGKIKCYYAFDCKKTKEIACEDTEAIKEVKEYSFDEYFSAVSKMDFRDALTETLIYKHLAKGCEKNG